MPNILALYLNSANPDQGWQTLDRAIFANLDDLRSGGSTLTLDEQRRVPIRWARQSDDHRVYGPDCPPWGRVERLWKGPRDFTLGELQQLRVSQGLGTAPATTSMLDSRSVESFLGRIGASDGSASIVFGGHGDGPYATMAAMDFDNMTGIDVTPSWLTPGELTHGLRAVGFGPDRRFQVMGFDNCQQASLELAIELREFAHYLVAAQLNVPGLGWSYRDWPAVALRGADAKKLVKAMVDSYRSRYDADEYPSQTITAIELAPMQNVATALHAFCDEALSLTDQRPLRRLRDLRTALPSIPLSRVSKVDAFAFFDACAQDASTDSVMRAHARAICASIAAATVGSWIPKAVHCKYQAHGLSIVFPATRNDVSDVLQTEYFDAHDNLATFRQSRWPKLVQTIVGLP